MSLGIYIHIPFCQAKCSYCHFSSMQFQEDISERYRKAVLEEIRSFAPNLEAPEVDSVYFGGGTPSLLPAEHISDIVRACRRKFSFAGDCEISMESNPGTLSPDKIAVYRDAGINRISVGAQSFVNGELASVGRLHTADMVRESVDRLRAGGFENINLDLMLGLPGQTAESWRQTLEETARCSVSHLSVYMLDLNEPCRLQSMVAEGSVCLPGEDLISDLYLETLGFLAARGYEQYEISNFARPGYACRHNLKYWKREKVHGYGLGSYSFDGHFRYANSSDIDRYMTRVENGVTPVIWKEPVTAEQELQETLFLGLRLREGVDWNRLRGSARGEFLAGYEDSLKSLFERGLVEQRGPILRLTESGILLSNEVFQIFV